MLKSYTVTTHVACIALSVLIVIGCMEDIDEKGQREIIDVESIRQSIINGFNADFWADVTGGVVALSRYKDDDGCSGSGNGFLRWAYLMGIWEEPQYSDPFIKVEPALGGQLPAPGDSGGPLLTLVAGTRGIENLPLAAVTNSCFPNESCFATPISTLLDGAWTQVSP
ncbi:MAG: hypothetical protein GY847_09810 [Proteobacteria bacterium]|nr:hypothetical protein [Pseudomonadota bacterium]